MQDMLTGLCIPVMLSFILSTAINFSRSSRNLQDVGESGRKMKRTIPQTRVKPPRTINSSLHDAMAVCVWPIPNETIPVMT